MKAPTIVGAGRQAYVEFEPERVDGDVGESKKLSQAKSAAPESFGADDGIHWEPVQPPLKQDGSTEPRRSIHQDGSLRGHRVLRGLADLQPHTTPRQGQATEVPRRRGKGVHGAAKNGTA